MRPPIVRALARHFLAAIVRPPFLSELGNDFLRRTAASVLAMVLIIGAFLTRALFKKYVDLHARWDVDAYWSAVRADTLMMIAIPMVLVGIVTVLLVPLLYPDETDYRTLSPLPVTRAELFVAKFAAVGAAAVILIATVNAVSTLWFPLAVSGRWTTEPLLRLIAVHASVSVAGSLTSFLAVMALHGSCMVLFPARLRRQMSVGALAVSFLLLLLCVPYVIRMPTWTVNDALIRSTALGWLPPVWFFGLEQWLLGGPGGAGYRPAADTAALSCVTAALIMCAAYLLLFRSAERLASDVVARRRRSHFFGLTSFVFSGLTRSRLHQFVFLVITGAGAAMLIGQALTIADGASFRTARPQAAVDAALAAPLLVALAVTLAMRAVFLLPLDVSATWIFRLTETPQTRCGALDVVANILTVATQGSALITVAAMQPHTLGARSWISGTLTVLAAGSLVEWVLRDWRRVPYTCSYLPGKRVLAYSLGVLLAYYTVFVGIGGTLVRWALVHPSRTLMLGGILLALFAGLRRDRLRVWGAHPLEFEDEDPLAIRRLHLIPD